MKNPAATTIVKPKTAKARVAKPTPAEPTVAQPKVVKVSQARKLLDCIDANWVADPKDLARGRALFLAKLAAREPDHPWVRQSADSRESSAETGKESC